MNSAVLSCFVVVMATMMVTSSALPWKRDNMLGSTGRVNQCLSECAECFDTGTDDVTVSLV